jgi:hypothetical protein
MKKKILSVVVGILFGLLISTVFTANNQEAVAEQQERPDWYYWWCGSPAGNVCCLHW